VATLNTVDVACAGVVSNLILPPDISISNEAKLDDENISPYCVMYTVEPSCMAKI
jgi:hypothetical protein